MNTDEDRNGIGRALVDASHECRSVGGVSYEVVCHGIVEEVVPADVRTRW